MTADPYRPLYHFTPPSGWTNDPNGLVYLDGEYHLFYQHLPAGHDASGGASLPHWGHAVSADLVHWTHLPIALYPDHLGAIFSGSAVVDAHDTSGFFGGRSGLVAIFTHHNDGAPPLGPEVQSIAYSADRGRTWNTYAHNPVIANPGAPDFRDPKVFWHAPTGCWVMVVTFHADRVRFYTSPNLRDWTYTGEFGATHGAQGAAWECPDLFELPVDGDPGQTRWVLNLSTYHDTPTTQHAGMQYFVGAFDGATFTTDPKENPTGTVRTTDDGRDNYAAVTFSDLPAADGRRVMIGWMSDWIYALATPTAPWQGAMTIPRELRLRRTAAGLRLDQAPIAELARLRTRQAHWSACPLTPAAGLWLRDVGAAMELVLTVARGSAGEWGVRVHSAAAEFTTIGCDVRAATVFVDRTHSGITDFSPAFPGRHAGSLSPGQEATTLRIFLDRSSVEVFAGDGECVVSTLIFPTAERTALEVYAAGGEAQLVSLDVYHLAG